MENTARRRLMSEYRKLVENPLEGISAEPLDDNLFIWKAFITGYYMITPGIYRTKTTVVVLTLMIIGENV